MKNNRLLAAKGLAIGALAERTGLAVSAIRYYESQGLLQAARTPNGQRRFERAAIRRVSFVMIAQKFGFTIAEIKQQLDSLPGGQTPTPADWTKLAEGFRDSLNQRIAALEKMRDDLDGCIGCGCLSLPCCALYNPSDIAQEKGTGPRYLMGDRPETDASSSESGV